MISNTADLETRGGTSHSMVMELSGKVIPNTGAHPGMGGTLTHAVCSGSPGNGLYMQLTSSSWKEFLITVVHVEEVDTYQNTAHQELLEIISHATIVVVGEGGSLSERTRKLLWEQNVLTSD